MTVASNYHIEVNASDAGIYDRIVVMELIKTVAQTHQLDSVKQRHFKGVINYFILHLLICFIFKYFCYSDLIN